MHSESIMQIKEKLKCGSLFSQEEIARLKNDPRSGVRRLIRSWEKQKMKKQQLLEQFRQMNACENRLHAAGFQLIGGIDEAGRGPLAGPVVAACVILRPGTIIPGINDSKKLTAARRTFLYTRIREQALCFGIGRASAREIDRLNIYQAAKAAMVRAVEDMQRIPDYLLIDAMKLPIDVPQESLIKGDARSNSIAAASILAKVTRDRLMEAIDRQYPGYGFAAHKGYGTAAHLQALRELGPCPEHRMTFAPLSS